MKLDKFNELESIKEEYENLQDTIDFLKIDEVCQLDLYGETIFTEEQVIQYNLEPEIKEFKILIKNKLEKESEKLKLEMINKIKEIEKVLKNKDE